MPVLRAFVLVLLALGAGLPRPAGADLVKPLLCPQAEILCLQKLGYNWQKCGTLTGPGGGAQEFPLCPAADGYACVPCWFGSLAETAAQCRARFGPDCGHFVERDARWRGEWGAFAWPENSSLFLLFGAGPH